MRATTPRATPARILFMYGTSLSTVNGISLPAHRILQLRSRSKSCFIRFCPDMIRSFSSYPTLDDQTTSIASYVGVYSLPSSSGTDTRPRGQQEDSMKRALRVVITAVTLVVISAGAVPLLTDATESFAQGGGGEFCGGFAGVPCGLGVGCLGTPGGL